MAAGVVLKEFPAATPTVRPDDDAAPAVRWADSIARSVAVRGARAEARARCAWLLAVDVADAAVEGTGFARIYSTPGKVGRGSDARTALARKVACYLTSTVGDCDVAMVARAARLDRKTVHKHLREVEDMRDDGAIDVLLDEMGRQMLTAAASVVLANLGGAA